MSLDTDISTETPVQKGWGPRGTAAATFAGSLEFSGVSKRFDGNAAVNNVSLTLEPGEILCLLGQSGCGKTTLLRLAAGVETPDAGQVVLGGQVVAGPGTMVPPEKRSVGLMFQDFALFPHLTILENVAFGLRNLDRQTAQKEAILALTRVGLEHYASNYPHMLSGGEQQRVALARAIVPRPAVILMDEPFSGLDQRLRDHVRAETLALLKETRATCMLVTHDPEEAMWLADRIALMRKGKLVQVGSPTELYNSPADAGAARFFSDFNEFSTKISRGRADTPLGPIKAKGHANADTAKILIRPQGIVLARNQKSVGFDAYVASARFVGECTIATLSVQGIDEPISARLTGAPDLAAGDIRKFSLMDEHILIFSDEETI